MGNAQDATEEYKNWIGHARQVDAEIVPQTYKNVAMILDHEYADNGNMKYRVQRQNGFQKWVKLPQEYCFEWLQLVKEYWANQTENEDPPTWDDLDTYL